MGLTQKTNFTHAGEVKKETLTSTQMNAAVVALHPRRNDTPSSLIAAFPLTLVDFSAFSRDGIQLVVC